MHEIKRQRKPLRLKNWDYSSTGYYFITICSKERENIFSSFVGAELASAPTISRIIQFIKSKCSTEYLKLIYEHNINVSGKIWQRSFHDHIIRNERSLYAIKEYIADNPENWEQDIDNLINL